jgi:predicted DNA-binding transcriptional regulator AlpA
MNDHAPQQEYVRTREAARYLSLSPRTLEKLRVNGSGPDYFKLGRAVLYAICELDAWIARNRRSSTSDGAALVTMRPNDDTP